MRDIGGPGGHHLVWGGPQRGYLDNGNYYLPQHTYSAIASIFKARFTFFHFMSKLSLNQSGTRG